MIAPLLITVFFFFWLKIFYFSLLFSNLHSRLLTTAFSATNNVSIFAILIDIKKKLLFQNILFIFIMLHHLIFVVYLIVFCNGFLTVLLTMQRWFSRKYLRFLGGKLLFWCVYICKAKRLMVTFRNYWRNVLIF
jgi:hypothetical protein